MGIAGSEVGLPSSVEEVTAEWLTTVLRTSGAIDAGTSVASVTTEPFAVGAGLLSLLYQSAMTFNGGTGPATVIVKFASDDPMQRMVADVLQFYARELKFYRDFAPSAPFGTAQCHAAIMAEDSTDFVVVMEDLSSLRAVDQRDGCSWDEVVSSIRSMASFHAQWFDSGKLAEISELFLPVKNDMYMATLPDMFAQGWVMAKEHGAQHLPAELIEFGDRWGDYLEFFLDELMEPRTIIHGDWRADNLMFGDLDDAGLPPVTVIDFQIVSVGSGIYDVAYFASQSIAEDVRSGRDGEIVRLYLDALATHGVTLSFEDAMRQYKIGVAFDFVYGVISFQSYLNLPDRAQELLQTFLGRSSQAILDVEALAELPS